MKTRNKKIIIVSLPLFLILLLISWNGCNSTQDKHLDETQISVLREKYPICGLKVPAMLDIVPLSLDEVKNYAETFVYGEVVGDYDTYSIKISTGNALLDEQRKENGITDEYTFYEYTISVITDTEGIMEKGEQITISSNIVFMDYNPKLEDGMKVVVPVMWRDEDKVDRTYYTMSGMFYVTENEYAISVFDESKTYSKDILSGVYVDTLLKKLKK